MDKKFIYKLTGYIVFATGIVILYFGVFYPIHKISTAGENSIIDQGRNLAVIVKVLVLFFVFSLCVIASGYMIVKTGNDIHLYPAITITPVIFLQCALLVGAYGAIFVLRDMGAHGLAGLRFFVVQLPVSVVLFFAGNMILMVQKNRR